MTLRPALLRASCKGPMLLVRLIDIYWVILFVSVLLSWTGLPNDHPLMKISRALTEPLLAPIRRVLPTVGGFDLSPMVLIFALSLLRRALHR
jgi:YggT family protein